MKIYFFFLTVVTFILISISQSPEPNVRQGKIDRYKDFSSEYVTARNVDVWLPENYNPGKKYAVLYMHDGQMLFDASTTWNQQAWEVDSIAGELMEKGKIRDVIVVGIWNGNTTRHADYFPQKPFESLNRKDKKRILEADRDDSASLFQGHNINSDNYLKFLVKELKPFIDKKYSTHTGKDHTFIAGSSMGGLISLYAVCEYPEVFGGAACLSTHWPGILSMEDNPVPDAFLRYLEDHLPDPSSHLIYFDYGTEDLDALYPPLQKQVDKVMKAKGFTEKSWITKEFPGEGHNENAWRDRLHHPLLFLLGTDK